MPEKIVVIGGGFAGLTSAALLSQQGHKILLFEASSKSGGRAYSFTDTVTGDVLDNGQHILMGCYHETLHFLSLIGAKKNFTFQKKLKIDFLRKNFEVLTLQASALPYPLNMLTAMLNYQALELKDKLLMIRFFLRLPFILQDDIRKLSVSEWLIEEKQTNNTIKSFWEILCVGALNTSPIKASAFTFYSVIKAIFFRDNTSAAIILPAHGLSDAYVKAAEEFINSKQGEIYTDERVISLEAEGTKIVKIITAKRELTEFDSVIAAIPFHSLEKIVDVRKTGITFSPEYSSILNIHIWLKNNPLSSGFYGLIDSEIHWIFNKQTHLNIVISDAGKFIGMDKDDLLKIIKSELQAYTNINEDNITAIKIIHEKRATFIPSKEIINSRPKSMTSYENFFLAGDWIDTGLPSTIESAVKSGRMAAEALVRSVSTNSKE